MHALRKRRLGEAAIGAAHDILLTDDLGKPDNALRHQFRMFDNVGGVADDAGMAHAGHTYDEGHEMDQRQRHATGTPATGTTSATLAAATPAAATRASAQPAAAPRTPAATMKAFVRHVYGPPDVVELVDRPVPVPEDDEILVRVRAASVNPVDWYEITGRPYFTRVMGGLRRPKEPSTGRDMAGVVAAVGSAVTEFRTGDEVYGMRMGAFAEYVCIREARAVRKPANASFEQAAAIPVAGLTALQALRDKGGIEAGQSVLVIGGSGGVGTFGVQLAKAFGAEVTAVCSTRNVEAVRALGADTVVDYTREDFVSAGRRYDLVLDVAGNRSVRERRRVLTPEGTLVMVGGPKKNRLFGPMLPMVWMLVVGRLSGRRMTMMVAANSKQDLELLRDLVEAGKVTPVVERTYPLRDLPEALNYLGTGHAQAKLTVTV